MATHETVRAMTHGQFKDIIATMVGAVPSLSFEEAKRIIGGKTPFVAEICDVFERRREQVLTSGTPANGEIFELALGTQTRLFTLAQVGCCRNLDEVAWKVKAEYGGGTLAGEEWREAFRKKYPKPSKGDLIGFGSPPLVDRHSLPALGEWFGEWRLGFGRSDRALPGNIRWVVEIT